MRQFNEAQSNRVPPVIRAAIRRAISGADGGWSYVPERHRADVVRIHVDDSFVGHGLMQELRGMDVDFKTFGTDYTDKGEIYLEIFVSEDA